MIAGTIAKFLSHRRAATALIVAMMSIPLIIACGAAVDFSRLASARAQLQFAADSAALAGAGAFQTNQDGTAAYNVAKTAFNTSAANLGFYATVTSTAGTSCNPSGAAGITCGTKSAASGVTSLCPAATVYCVEVTAQAKLLNTLLAFAIPSEALRVTSVAQSTGATSVGTGNFSHVGVGYGSDLSAIYTYAVPTDSTGNPQYGNVPAPNADCSNSSYGPIQYVPSVAAANGVNSCNYVLIGENSGGSGSGNFSFPGSDPLAFTFVNFTAGTITPAHGPSDLDTTSFNSTTGVTTNTGNPTQYTNEIYVTSGGATSYQSSGETISGKALYGTCPAHNLYGSIEAYPDADPADNIVPYQDSINIFSTAWEMLGWPPTHGTNHALLPFLGPVTTQTIGSTTYTVRAICPQWPVSGTTITATASFSPSALPAGYAPVSNASSTYTTATNVLVYSTYYPDATFTSAAAGGTYPPAIAGCSPAMSAADGAVTPATYDPWWGWSPPNASQMDPDGAGENPGGGAVTNCTATKLNSGANGITTTQNSLQSPSYNNCAFIIQPLGTNVPETNGVPDLPDYYSYTVEPGAFTAKTTGNASDIISPPGAKLPGMNPVYSGGSVPTRISISGSGSGPFVVTEPPGYGRDNYPPEDTSHQCYNPQANGINGATLPSTDQPNNDTTTNPPMPIDPVENPEYGAVFCNTNPPPSFALLWNDMGAWAQAKVNGKQAELYNDDLGYSNAVTEFTCPTPGNPGTSGPASLLQ